MTSTGKYIKKLIPIAVEFAHAPGQAETLEGVVPYDAGDALLTGVNGEHWPVARDRFEETYEPVSGMCMGEDGFYSKRPILVDAVQTESEMVIAMKAHASKFHAKLGDWIVTAPDGAQWVVAGDIFLKTYKLFEQSEGEK